MKRQVNNLRLYLKLANIFGIIYVNDWFSFSTHVKKSLFTIALYQDLIFDFNNTFLKDQWLLIMVLSVSKWKHLFTNALENSVLKVKEEAVTSNCEKV